uniref:F-ATPase gamma subunit n=1 Tax=Hippocampus comes TaxID=109280 RepID=A0A3Q2Z5F0_HIPCM
MSTVTIRLKSIKNIQKITKSMKMVAAAKYARAERQLKPARVYGTGALSLYEKAEIKVPEDKAAKHLIIGVTSDRGLCGAIHSGVAKTIKNEIANLTGSGKEVMVVNVGDKLRGLLHKTHGKHIMLNCKEVGRKPPTFGDASLIASELLNSGYEFDQGAVIYNHFRSKTMAVYDDIDADVLRSYQEFAMVNVIYLALRESSTSEQSARMTAMDSASKNACKPGPEKKKNPQKTTRRTMQASEMIDKLTLTFNR